jgi:type II secretory pathway pseudopilin PulG
MNSRKRNIERNNQGYSLIEILIVTALIIILATMPIALLRRSREKTYEAEALRSLRMMSLAYESYYSVNGHKYPNYRSNGVLTEDIEYKSAQEIWDTFSRMSLIPSMYAGTIYNKRDLLARGYQLSIIPVDSGASAVSGVKDTYAIALIPYEASVADRGIAVIQGRRFFSSFPSAIPRNVGDIGLYSLKVYSLAD